MVYIQNASQSLRWNFIGWKSYNQIKKKAMEQEFSWSGLLVSLSIAFFVVLATSQLFNAINVSIMKQKPVGKSINPMYMLDRVENNNLLTNLV